MPYGYLAAIDEGRPSPLRWCSSWADGPGLHEKEQPRKPGGSSVSSWFLSPGCCLGSPQVAFGQGFSTATGNRTTRDKVSSGRDLQPLFTPLSHGSPLLAVWSTPFPVSLFVYPLSRVCWCGNPLAPLDGPELCFCALDEVSLDPAGLKLTIAVMAASERPTLLPPSYPRVLGSQACATTPGLYNSAFNSCIPFHSRPIRLAAHLSWMDSGVVSNIV